MSCPECEATQRSLAAAVEAALAERDDWSKRWQEDTDRLEAQLAAAALDAKALAAAEARESALLVLLEDLDFEANWKDNLALIDRVAAALSAPRDTAALDAMLARAIREAEAKRLSTAEALAREIEESRTRKAQLDLMHTSTEGVWKWQGEGDHLDSLACPVVMAPQTLKALLAKARGDAADCAENHYTAEEGRALEAQVAAERLKTAAAQARVVELREVLKVVRVDLARWVNKQLKKNNSPDRSLDQLGAIDDALARPDDLEALREFGRRMVERCAKAVLDGGFLHAEAPTARFAREVDAMFKRTCDEMVDAVLRGEDT